MASTSSVSEIGEAENISKSFVSRLLWLLAPDIVEAIPAGRTNQALVLEKLERPFGALGGASVLAFSIPGCPQPFSQATSYH